MMVYEKSGIDKRYADSTYLLNEIVRLKTEIAEIRQVLKERQVQMTELEKSTNVAMIKVTETLNKLSEQIEESELSISSSALEHKEMLYDTIVKNHEALHLKVEELQLEVSNTVNNMKLDMSNVVETVEGVKPSLENLENILQEKADKKSVLALHQRITTMFSLGIVNLVGSIMILALLSYLIFSLAR